MPQKLTQVRARGRARLYFLIKAGLCIRDDIIIYFLLVIIHRCYLVLRVPLTSDDFLSRARGSRPRRNVINHRILSMRTVRGWLGASRRQKVSQERNRLSEQEVDLPAIVALPLMRA